MWLKTGWGRSDFSTMNEFLVLVLAAAIIIFVLVIYVSKKRRRLGGKEICFIEKEWAKINGLLENGNGISAIIEADKALEFVLRAKGFSGSFQDKMRRAEGLFSKPQAVWDAHKLRNKCAHEAGFAPARAATTHALASFRGALKNLDSRFSL